MTLPSLSLYIHIPWCVRKCPYCDFTSHNAPDTLPQREYVEALLAEGFVVFIVESLHMGGGYAAFGQNVGHIVFGQLQRLGVLVRFLLL